jgi:hypothetical protein
MSYTSESGRRQIVEDSLVAARELAAALAALGDLYEHLDERSADRMEDELFRPLQSGYGQLRRTVTAFASRHGLAEPVFADPGPGLPEDPRAVIERVADAAQSADDTLAELQDSLLPVEVGDQELRAGLSRVRTLIAPVPAAADALVRTFGR